MSGQFSSAIIFTSLVAIALATHYADEDVRSTSTPSGRSPASLGSIKRELTDQKELNLGSFKPSSALRHTEKLHGPLSASIEWVGSPVSVGEAFILKGVMSSKQALDAAEFQWSLPKEVELINGSPTGTLGIPANQKVGIELTLRKLSDAPAYIYLLVTARRGESRFADSAQFNLLNGQQAQENSSTKQKGTNPLDPKSKNDFKVFH